MYFFTCMDKFLHVSRDYLLYPACDGPDMYLDYFLTQTNSYFSQAEPNFSGKFQDSAVTEKEYVIIK